MRGLHEGGDGVVDFDVGRVNKLMNGESVQTRVMSSHEIGSSYLEAIKAINIFGIQYDDEYGRIQNKTLSLFDAVNLHDGYLNFSSEKKKVY